MTKKLATIVFFGSGPVAAASLELLVQSFEIEAVVTKPRLAHHHGNVPVLELAEKLQLAVIEVSDKTELSRKIEAASFESPVGVLIDFGIIVDETVINKFPLGIVNSHFSLLPEWRGADPITFSILSGQQQTGVSLMLLVKELDEGPMLAQGVYGIKPDETTLSLTDYLIKISYTLLRDALPKYLAGKVKPRPQAVVAGMMHKPAKPSYSRKLAKTDGVIDWHKPAEVLEREIRAYIEWPKSRAVLAGKDVIITKAHMLSGETGRVKPGTIQTVKNGDSLVVITGNGLLGIERLKPVGKSEMTARAFLAGYGRELLLKKNVDY